MDSQVLTQEQNIPQPSVPVAEEKNKDWFKILLIVVGFLVISGLFSNGYLLLRKKNQNPPAQITPIPTQTVFLPTSIPTQTALLPTPTTDLTANWKTYRNEKFNFEFKHPSDWIYSSNPEKEISKSGDDLHVIRNQIMPFPTENKFWLLINIWDNPQKLSTTDWLRWHEGEYQKKGLLSEYKHNTVFSINAYVDSLPAYKDMREVENQKNQATAGSRGGSAFPLIDYYVVKGDELYAIELNNYDFEAFYYQEETIYNLFDQILSTFKFIESTASWKTYTFQPIQLSLKVPPELVVHIEEPNPGNDFTAYIQNYPYNLPFPKENAYQLYIIWQKTPITQIEFQQLKDDLNVNSIEDTIITSYPAIKGQVKGERNRFVVYILKENTTISLFTSEPTEVNRKLTDQILSTFKFLE